MGYCKLLILTTIFFVKALQGQPLDRRGLNGLNVVAFEQLSDPNITGLGRQALAIRENEWLHAETENFCYHFFPAFEGSATSIATSVAVEAEFYYRVFAEELGKDAKSWERKSHIFIFDRLEDWQEFQKMARLDPWTGGIHAQGELFILRRKDLKFKGHTIGHEVAHLVLHRFYLGGIPLWLDEGYAEYASSRAHANFLRSRGYAAKATSPPLSKVDMVPLQVLTSLRAYPQDEKQIAAFYLQSEKLTRFLAGRDKKAFVKFFDLIAGGRKFESAIAGAYPPGSSHIKSLEIEFTNYATSGIAEP